MMCDRCDQPIPAGESETIPIHGDSGAGGTVIVHRVLCRAPYNSRPLRYPVERRP